MIYVEKSRNRAYVAEKHGQAILCPLQLDIQELALAPLYVISIEFEIRSKLAVLWLCLTDHNEILHT